MTTRLILIVHAETAATRSAVFAKDEALAAPGLAAATALRPPVCDRALTSPALAARETARALGLSPTVDAALGDLAVGAWTGRSLGQVATDDPEGAAAFLADPLFDGHGGESVAALVARLGGWLEARRSPSGRLVAITHAAVVRAAVVAALEAPTAAFWRIDAAPLSVVTLTCDHRRWALRVG